MSSPITSGPIVYPEDDGLPMADNTVQFEWIQLLEGNLEILFGGRDDVFVGGNLLWYPVERVPTIRRAPDSFVVIGRPKGRRGSYRQWEEGGVPMTVVFEVRSPEDDDDLMAEKFDFYDTYEVSEYFVLDPQKNTVEAYQRRGGGLGPLRKRKGVYTSPLLGIRLVPGSPAIQVFYPDGQPFRSFLELGRLKAEAEQRALNAERRTARVLELVGRLRRGEATAEDLAELDRLQAE